MNDYSKWTNDEIFSEKARIDAELQRRFLGNPAGGYVVPTDGCCNKFLCEITACPRRIG